MSLKGNKKQVIDRVRKLDHQTVMAALYVRIKWSNI